MKRKKERKHVSLSVLVGETVSSVFAAGTSVFLVYITRERFRL